MCGFVALISPAVPIRRDLVDVLRDRMYHRGPDNGSSWIHQCGRVALGHRRLSIIDPSHAADQPMSTEDGEMRIVFNGEIYNYVELRAELESIGVSFRTRSDTEVLLAAIRAYGVAAIPKLNGMFAFAAYDERSHRLLIARDRFGEKPLFIGHGAFHTVVIASEMKAVLAHPLVVCSASEIAMQAYTKESWYEDGCSTFFEGIERLPPAHAAWYRMDGTEECRWRYWTPNYEHIDDALRPQEAVERFGELLQRSINIRLRADVPVGSSLSGGLDSSTIVGFLTRERSSNSFTQNTFSACFPSDPTISEDPEIDAVVEHTGVNSYRVVPDPKRLVAESELLHWHQEEPFLSASIYLQWCVARLARDHDTTVLLDGQGADELLAGYQYYFRQRQLDLIDNGRLDLALTETKNFTGRLEKAGSHYADSYRRFDSKVAYTTGELVTMSSPPPVFHYPYETGTAPPKPGFRLRRTLSEGLLYNSLPMLLRYADRNAMAFARETRMPFLDYDLVDFCISLPDDLLVRNGWQKWVLRQAADDTIPESIRWRADKVGYAAPLDLWLRNELREWARERLWDNKLKGVPDYNQNTIAKLWDQHQANRANHSWALWRWISLSEWLQLLRAGWWRSGIAHVPTLFFTS